jgi:hypothetical protein
MPSSPARSAARVGAEATSPPPRPRERSRTVGSIAPLTPREQRGSGGDAPHVASSYGSPLAARRSSSSAAAAAATGNGTRPPTLYHGFEASPVAARRQPNGSGGAQPLRRGSGGGGGGSGSPGAGQRAGPAGSGSGSGGGRSRLAASGGAASPAPQQRHRQQRLLALLREPLPDGWEARLTPTGQVYYANHAARRTQWVRPNAPATADTAARRERDRDDYDRRSLLSVDMSRSGGGGDSGVAAASMSSVPHDHVLDADGFGFPSASPPTSRRPLPPARPSASHVSTLSPSAPSRRVLQLGGSGGGGGGGSRPSVPPRPPRSAAVSSPPRGAPSSSSSARSRGKVPATASSSNPHDRDWREYLIDEDLGEFPVGWERRLTPTGAAYFVDHVHRTTTFEDPRLASREERKQAAIQHEASLPQYKRDLRRKLLRLHDLFRHTLRGKETALRTGASGAAAAAAVSGGSGPHPTGMPLLKVDIAVSRDRIFEDSYLIIMKLRPDQLEGKLQIQFFGEDALDYGGVSREWFYSLSKEMMNPYYGLFQPSSNDQCVLLLLLLLLLLLRSYSSSKDLFELVFVCSRLPFCVSLTFPYPLSIPHLFVCVQSFGPVICYNSTFARSLGGFPAVAPHCCHRKCAPTPHCCHRKCVPTARQRNGFVATPFTPLAPVISHALPFIDLTRGSTSPSLPPPRPPPSSPCFSISTRDVSPFPCPPHPPPSISLPPRLDQTGTCFRSTPSRRSTRTTSRTSNLWGG